MLKIYFFVIFFKKIHFLSRKFDFAVMINDENSFFCNFSTLNSRTSVISKKFKNHLKWSKK